MTPQERAARTKKGNALKAQGQEITNLLASLNTMRKGVDVLRSTAHALRETGYPLIVLRHVAAIEALLTLESEEALRAAEFIRHEIDEFADRTKMIEGRDQMIEAREVGY